MMICFYKNVKKYRNDSAKSNDARLKLNNEIIFESYFLMNNSVYITYVKLR